MSAWTKAAWGVEAIALLLQLRDTKQGGNSLTVVREKICKRCM